MCVRVCVGQRVGCAGQMKVVVPGDHRYKEKERERGEWAGWALPCRSCCRSKFYFFLTWPIEVNKPCFRVEFKMVKWKWWRWLLGSILWPHEFTLQHLPYSFILDFHIPGAVLVLIMQRQDTIRYLNFKCSSSCQNVLGCPFHGQNVMQCTNGCP